MKTVHVSSSELGENAVAFIALLPRIKCAEFFRCDFHPFSLDAFKSSKITWLQIRDSKVLSSVISFSPADIADISAMTHLVHLELARSELAADSIRAVSKSSAQVANFRSCDLTDADLKNISKMSRLRFIDVSSNPKLTIRGVRTLLAAPKIQQIKCDLDLSKLPLSHAERQKVNPSAYHVPASFYKK